MFQFPIKLPEGAHLDLAQNFHVAAPVDLSKALSIQTTDHLGVDITCGTPQETWGKECVWPFPFEGVVYDAQVDAPFNALQHAHAQIDGTDPLTEIKYSLIYIHLSAVTHPKTPLETTLITYQKGDVIGRIGNNGFVNPAPTPTHPFDGSHLHLGVGVKKPGDLNFTMVDPLLYFDITNPFRGPSLKPKFMVNLSFGKTSGDISNLQKVLQGLGFFPQNQQITGYYGPKTASGVLQFRLKYGISSDTDTQGHSVGPITRQALNNL